MNSSNKNWHRPEREKWRTGKTPFGLTNGAKISSGAFTLEGLAQGRHKRLQERHAYPLGLGDHTRYWIKDGKPYAITTEPYPSVDLIGLQIECDRLGLEMTVGETSEWNPGHCQWIQITRK